MGTILVAEDSATQAVQIQVLLQSAGHEVILVGNGTEAVAALADNEPDLLVTDLHMPEMDGLELVEHVRSHHSEVPVVVLTADTSNDVSMLALQRGAASYIPKVEMAQSLIPSVAEIMDLLESRQTKAEVMSALVAAESTYVFSNDHKLAGRVIAQLEQQLRTLEYDDATGVLRITMAVKEAVTNAIDHGNLELDSDLRDDDPDRYWELGVERSRQKPWKHRRVTLTMKVTPHEVRYTIQDEGPGFDPTSLPDPTDPENLLRAHGRGLMLIRNFMDDVTHNPTGNVITLVKRKNESGLG